MMKQSIVIQDMLWFALFFMCIIIIPTIPTTEAYKNYTVGDSLGWFDKLAKPGLDFDHWVSTKSFSLGDFLSKFLSFFFVSFFFNYLFYIIH